MIEIQLDSSRSKYISLLADKLSSLTEHEGVIEAKITDSKEIKQLNKEYASNDYSTDVLSFSNLESDAADQNQTIKTASSNVLGQVFISQGHVVSQAKAAGTDEETELILLLMHGCLHILGYDHDNQESQTALDSLQQQLMQDIGLEYRDFNWQSS